MSEGRLRPVERALLWWVDGVHLRPVRALVLLAILSIGGLGLAVTDLKINTDSSELINPKLPFRQAQLEFGRTFPHLDNNILVLVEARSQDEADAFAQEFARRLEPKGDIIRDVFSPTIDPFFVQNGLLFLDSAELETRLQEIAQAGKLLEDLMLDPSLARLFESLASSRALASAGEMESDQLDHVYVHLARIIESRLAGQAEPLSWQALFSRSETPVPTRRLITVSPQLDFTALQPAKQALQAIREVLDELKAEKITVPAPDGSTIMTEQRWDVEVGITGKPVLRFEELRSVSNGIGLSFMVSVLAVGLILWLAMRSWHMVGVAILTLIVTITITAGFGALAIGSLNLISIAFTVLLIGLGIDFAIHFALHIQETRQLHGRVRGALRSAVREVGGALSLCAPTTAFAFFAFVPTNFVGMAQLGVLSGAGVIVAFLVAITVIPAALTLWPINPRKTRPNPLFDTVSHHFGRSMRPLAILTAIFGIGALFLLPQVQFDADPMSLRDPNSPSVRTFEKLFEEAQSRPYRLNILEKDLETAQATAAKIGTNKEIVERTLTLADFVPENQSYKLDLIDYVSGSPSFVFANSATPARTIEHKTGIAYEVSRRSVESLREALEGSEAGSKGDHLHTVLGRLLEETQAMPRLYDGLERDFFRFWEFQINRLISQLSPSPVALESLPDDLKERYTAPDGRQRVEVVPAQNVRQLEHRRTFVQAVAEQAPEATGSALTVLRSGDVVANAMLQASLTAALVVTLVLWLLLREAVTVAMILFPVILAAVLTAGAGVLLNVPFNFANVIVIPLLIGLGADSAIHLALRARQLRRRTAVFSTSTPRAVLFSALTTIASFGSLALSDHRGTASMGELLTISIAFTLICSLIVLPVVFDAVDRRRSRLNR